MIDPSLCIAILTYGSRQHLLEEILDAIEKSTCLPGRVVVVDNASIPKVQIKNNHSFPIELYRNETNTGSAGGFYRCLIEAVREQTEKVLLLDDDNYLSPDCIERLVTNYRKSSILVAHRPNRPEYRAQLKAGGAGRPAPSSFMGFSIFTRKNTPPEKTNELYFFGYGGALLPANVVRSGILPNPSLFLYYDDSEWSIRLRAGGYKAQLISAAEITDIDAPWGGFSHKKSSPLFSIQTPRSKLWYAIRNRAFIERKLDAKIIPLFINFSIWSFMLITKTAFAEFAIYRFITNIKDTISAFISGWRGIGISPISQQHNAPTQK